ncbi:MAG TPA: hypothetical protein VLM40_13600 [Gemmata sp.]|nr:hypothetical protein [Gemmata sp.]
MVLTRLRRLVKEESTQGSRPIEELEKPNILLEDLELTLLPRKSKPGSVEALIDGLTDYWEDPEDSDNEEGQTAYWKLAERGLEAVPVLVEHRRDYRLTRTKATHPKAFVKCDVMRVNQLVEDLLNKLSGERFDAEEYWTRLEDYKPPKDHKWWAEARKMGEERWLLTIVLPPPRMVGEESFEPHTPNEIALRVIRAKYPNRLAEVYRKLMKDRPMISSEMVAKEIVASNLPRDRKLGLLEEGATNKDFSHRLHALEALATVDGPLFRKLLLKSIQNIPSEITFKQDAYNPEILVAELIRKTDDRDCWNALAELTRAASPSTRHHLINSAGWPAEPGEADPGRRQCIKFLQLFLNDCEIGDMPWQGPQAVRDHATKRLAHLLGLAELDYVKNLRSPREISILRDVVREAADREVVRPRK